MKYIVKFKKGPLIFYSVLSVILTLMFATILIIEVKENSDPGMVTTGGATRFDKIYYTVIYCILLSTTFRLARIYSRRKLVYDENVIEGCIPCKKKSKDIVFSVSWENVLKIVREKNTILIQTRDGEDYLFLLVKNAKFHEKNLKNLLSNARSANMS